MQELFRRRRQLRIASKHRYPCQAQIVGYLTIVAGLRRHVTFDGRDRRVGL